MLRGFFEPVAAALAVAVAVTDGAAAAVVVGATEGAADAPIFIAPVVVPTFPGTCVVAATDAEGAALGIGSRTVTDVDVGVAFVSAPADAGRGGAVVDEAVATIPPPVEVV